MVEELGPSNNLTNTNILMSEEKNKKDQQPYRQNAKGFGQVDMIKLISVCLP